MLMHLCMQATLPNRAGSGGTFKPYMKGVYFAYAFVCYCYFTVAIAGYWAFGQRVQDNVMLSIARPKWVVAAADMFVVIHVFGSYQVCSPYLLVVCLADSIMSCCSLSGCSLRCCWSTVHAHLCCDGCLHILPFQQSLRLLDECLYDCFNMCL